MDCHAKTQPINGQHRQSPIGPGGKIDDTSCLVAQVVEWTEAHGEAWAQIRSKKMWRNIFSCGGAIPTCEDEYVVTQDRKVYETSDGGRKRNYPAKPNANSFSTYFGSFDEYSTADSSQGGRRARRFEESDEEEETARCSVM